MWGLRRKDSTTCRPPRMTEAMWTPITTKMASFAFASTNPRWPSSLSRVNLALSLHSPKRVRDIRVPGLCLPDLPGMLCSWSMCQQFVPRSLFQLCLWNHWQHQLPRLQSLASHECWTEVGRVSYSRVVKSYRFLNFASWCVWDTCKHAKTTNTCWLTLIFSISPHAHGSHAQRHCSERWLLQTTYTQRILRGWVMWLCCDPLASVLQAIWALCCPDLFRHERFKYSFSCLQPLQLVRLQTRDTSFHALSPPAASWEVPPSPFKEPPPSPSQFGGGHPPPPSKKGGVPTISNRSLKLQKFASEIKPKQKTTTFCEFRDPASLVLRSHIV